MTDGMIPPYCRDILGMQPALDVPLQDRFGASRDRSRYGSSGGVGDWITTIWLMFRDPIDRFVEQFATRRLAAGDLTKDAFFLCTR